MIMAAMLSTAAHRRTGAPDLSLSARRVWPRNRSTGGRTRCDIGAVGAFKQRRIQVIGMPDDRWSLCFEPIRERRKERVPPAVAHRPSAASRGDQTSSRLRPPRRLERRRPTARAALGATQIHDAKARRRGARNFRLRRERCRHSAVSLELAGNDAPIGHEQSPPQRDLANCQDRYPIHRMPLCAVTASSGAKSRLPFRGTTP